MPFAPGPGVGGHCLPVDPSYLSWQAKRSIGHRFRFIELANDINDAMPRYVVQRVVLGLNARGRAVNGSRLLLLGLAYKKNVGDLRESPASVVAGLLVRLGATVHAVEPHAGPGAVTTDCVNLVDLTEAELAAADAVIVLADHDSFDYESVQRSARYVFDTRNRCAGANVETL
jgi:UDP-N-acetyl-D-glucosamine dehydrogenase